MRIKVEEGEEVPDEELEKAPTPYLMFHCDDKYNITMRNRHGHVIDREHLDRLCTVYTSLAVSARTAPPCMPPMCIAYVHRLSANTIV